MRPLVRTFISTLFFCAFAVLSRGADSRALRVVTFNTVLTEVAREVGGADVVVTGLVKPGVDPHTFDPSPTDMRAIVEADLVLASGLNLEPYLDRLVAGAGLRGRIVAVGDRLPNVLSLQVVGHPRDEKDPHWWHSVANVIFATEVIRTEYALLRPELAGVFARNAATYRQRLADLKTWADQEIARLPPARRHLITSHDAFGYFARDYGFVVHAINGLSTEGEANAKHVAELIEIIRREKIGAVFAENSVNPRLIENLVSETNVRLGGTLYADGLGPVGSDAGTYDAMYRHNVRAIVEALAGR